MWSLLSCAAVGSLAFLPSASAGSSLGLFEAEIGYTSRSESLSVQLEQQLVPLLSSTATIHRPTDANWANETERYMQDIKPRVQLSIHVGTEEDVATVVSCLPL